MSENGRGKLIPGFLISNFNARVSQHEYLDVISGSISFGGWEVQRLTFNHFLNEKPFTRMKIASSFLKV